MEFLPLTAALFAFGCGTADAQVTPATSAECGAAEGTIRVTDDARITADPARTSEADARMAALRAFPGARITEIDLDEEDGFLVYEVDLTLDRAEYELLIDAGTGRVLCSERD
jgi:uncharacterized membrane protein YkoI